MKVISNIELTKLVKNNEAKMYVDGVLPPRNIYIKKNEIIILDVIGEQYNLDRELFFNGVVIWNFNKSQISFNPLIVGLEKMYAEMG
jgi:hypothetical protein